MTLFIECSGRKRRRPVASGQAQSIENNSDFSGIAKMKVIIKEWNAVASWRWDMPEDDVCGICRVQFDGTCPQCNYPGDECTLRTYDALGHYLKKNGT